MIVKSMQEAQTVDKIRQHLDVIEKMAAAAKVSAHLRDTGSIGDVIDIIDTNIRSIAILLVVMDSIGRMRE